MKRLIYRVYTFLKDHSDSCHFFDEFGILIQFILGMICLSALMLKRTIEKPRRPWSIWFFDTVKQGAGQFSQHFANLLIANKLGQHSGLECEWYLNNLMADSTLGVLLSYFYLQMVLKVLSGTKLEFQSGDYGQGETTDDSKEVNWKCNLVLYQILWWVMIVLLAKFTTLGILYSFYRIVENAGKLILQPVKSDPKLKLIFVMIIFPTIFNIIQFWFTDNFIKNNIVSSEMKEDVTSNNNLSKLDQSVNVNGHGYNAAPGLQNHDCSIKVETGKDKLENSKFFDKEKNKEIDKDKHSDKDYHPLPTSDHNV
jgi:hypothetical protein